MILLQDLLEIHMVSKRSYNSPMRDPMRGKRPPLRTFKEVAEDLGIAPQRLSVLIKHHNGPQPKIRSKGVVASNNYYDPAEVRAWWNSLPDSVRAQH